MDFAEMEGMLPGLFEGGKGWGTCLIVWGVLGDMCDMCFVPLSAMIMLLQILCQPRPTFECVFNSYF